MEMIMEGQNTFLRSFQKTFVDNLILQNDSAGGGLTRGACDWYLSSLGGLIAVIDLFLYIPIRRYGYAKVYTWVFQFNSILALCTLSSVPHNVDLSNYLEYTTPIFVFICVYSILNAAMSSAGFGLAMADMVLEMKLQKAEQNRWDEPAIAGLFMGINALFCKPSESVLPIITATLLGNTNLDNTWSSAKNHATTNDHNVQSVCWIYPTIHRLVKV